MCHHIHRRIHDTSEDFQEEFCLCHSRRRAYSMADSMRFPQGLHPSQSDRSLTGKGANSFFNNKGTEYYLNNVNHTSNIEENFENKPRTLENAVQQRVQADIAANSSRSSKHSRQSSSNYECEMNKNAHELDAEQGSPQRDAGYHNQKVNPSTSGYNKHFDSCMAVL